MKIHIKNSILSVEVVDTDELRTKGLQGRSALEENLGMFFVFDYSDSYTFHMHNVKFPLDMIFIDSSGKILKIVSAFPEEDMILGARNTKYVIETNLDWCRQNNVKIGDQVMFSRRQERIASRKKIAYESPQKIPEKWTDQEVKEFISVKLYGLHSGDLENVLRKAIFSLSSKIDWNATRKEISKQYPEFQKFK